MESTGNKPRRHGVAEPGPRQPCFACMNSLSYHRASATCCARLTDLIAIFGIGSSTLRLPHSART